MGEPWILYKKIKYEILNKDNNRRRKTSSDVINKNDS